MKPATIIDTLYFWRLLSWPSASHIFTTRGPSLSLRSTFQVSQAR